MPGCSSPRQSHNPQMPEKASHAATAHRDSTRVISTINRLSAPDIDRDAALHPEPYFAVFRDASWMRTLQLRSMKGSRIPPTTHLRLRPDRCSRGSTLSGTYEPAALVKCSMIQSLP
jgi:hypothetical protein